MYTFYLLFTLCWIYSYLIFIYLKIQDKIFNVYIYIFLFIIIFGYIYYFIRKYFILFITCLFSELNVYFFNISCLSISSIMSNNITAFGQQNTFKMRTVVLLLSVMMVRVLLMDATVESTAEFDPYKVLGVTRSASQAEIKKVYKRLAKEWWECYFFFS